MLQKHQHNRNTLERPLRLKIHKRSMESKAEPQDPGGDLRGADSGARSSNEDVRMEVDEREGARAMRIEELGLSQDQDDSNEDVQDLIGTLVQEATMSDVAMTIPVTGGLDLVRAGTEMSEAVAVCEKLLLRKQWM